MESLSPQEQQRLQEFLQKKQLRDFIGLYNNLTEHCFTACCHEFKGRKLTDTEKSCVDVCFQKFIQSSNRIGQRFQEVHGVVAQGALPGQ
eukprot:m.16540 g.16540  ORF g.16540 m.16540 type:complete len:90 (+) comp7108_c0_seq1:163-432(+)